MSSPTPALGAEPLVEIVLDLVTALVGAVDRQEVLASLVDRARGQVSADEVGILLADASGELRLVSATSSAPEVVELLERRDVASPVVEAFTAGATPSTAVSGAQRRWPQWSENLVAQGFSSVVTAPLRTDGDRFGAMVALRRSGTFTAADTSAIAALARVAALVIVFEQERENRRSFTEQLQEALDSRVVIEQAKGIVAARESIDPDSAFRRIRSHARDNGLLLHDVARRIVESASARGLGDSDLPGARPTGQSGS